MSAPPTTPPGGGGVEEDAARVRRARAGDASAFEELVTAHRSAVEAITRRRLGSGPDAEDAAQDIFLAALRSLDGLDDERRFGPWLRAIAANACAKAIGRRVIQRQRFAHPALLDEIAWPDASESEGVSAGALREAFDALAPEDRAAATFFHLLGLPQAEIARLQGVPIGTVKSRLHRARGQIGRRWSQMRRDRDGSDEGLAPDTREQDYGRAVVVGMRGRHEWQRLLGAEGLEGWEPSRPGCWRREGDVILGAAKGDTGARLAIGDSSWQDYELSVLVTLLRGGNVQIAFRTSPDGQQFYSFDLLAGWQAVAVSRGDRRRGKGLLKLSVVNFPFEPGREYDVMIAARGASLTTYVDGKLVNQLTDRELPNGGVALTTWQCESAFRDPRIRRL